MKHAGKAQQAAWRLIFLSLGAVLVLLVVSFLAKVIASFVLGLTSVLLALWVLFSAFTLYFFRDPEPQAPADRAAIVSPAPSSARGSIVHGRERLLSRARDSWSNATAGCQCPAAA